MGLPLVFFIAQSIPPPGGATRVDRERGKTVPNCGPPRVFLYWQQQARGRTHFPERHFPPTDIPHPISIQPKRFTPDMCIGGKSPQTNAAHASTR